MIDNLFQGDEEYCNQVLTELYGRAYEREDYTFAIEIVVPHISYSQIFNLGKR